LRIPGGHRYGGSRGSAGIDHFATAGACNAHSSDRCTSDLPELRVREDAAGQASVLQLQQAPARLRDSAGPGYGSRFGLGRSDCADGTSPNPDAASAMGFGPHVGTGPNPYAASALGFGPRAGSRPDPDAASALGFGPSAGSSPDPDTDSVPRGERSARRLSEMRLREDAAWEVPLLQLWRQPRRVGQSPHRCIVRGGISEP
jgi:hypothetical protein